MHICRMKTDQQLLAMIAEHEAPLAVILHNIEGPGASPMSVNQLHFTQRPALLLL